MAEKRAPLNWYKAFGFEEENFCFQMAWILGQAYDRQADIAEVMATCYSITDGDVLSWYREFLKTADRVFNTGVQCEAGGHPISAGEAYHRASNYYRGAEFYLHRDPADARALGAAKKAVDCFQKAMQLLGVPVELVRIPFEGTTLPGYLYRPPSAGKDSPLLIVQTGFDGTAEELYGTADAALRRGYRCLIFEGPGQGQALRAQGLLFRPNWESVISPVIDFALEATGCDPRRLAVLGYSFGGWLVGRAACFEHRPRVYVADPGAFSFGEGASQHFPAELIQLVKSDPEAFNSQIERMRGKSVVMDWGISDGMWKFGCSSPAEFITKIQVYSLTDDLVSRITSHMVIIDSEGEDMAGEGQPQRMYKAIRGSKEYMLFTLDEAAEAHCQIAAYSVLYQRLFDRLDELLASRT